MKRSMSVLGVMLIIPFVTGCGTLCRGIAKVDFDVSVYPATTGDLAVTFAGMHGVAVPYDNDNQLEGFPRALSECFYCPLQVLVSLVDLPISLITDTLLLPYDLWIRHKNIAIGVISHGFALHAMGNPSETSRTNGSIMTNTISIVRYPRTLLSGTTTQTVTLAQVREMTKWEDEGMWSLLPQLIAMGYVTNGTSLSQAIEILGEPTHRKDNRVEWYFNGRWHVFPSLSATVTNNSMNDVRIIKR